MFNIRYDKKWFTFWHEGKRLKSVSKFLGEFSPPFDQQGVSLKCAQSAANKLFLVDRIRRTDEQIKEMQNALIAKWELKGKNSRDKGTLIHKCIEDFIVKKDRGILLTDLFTPETLIKLYDQLDTYLQDYEVISTEGIVGDPELGIAGIFDCLLRHKITKEYFLLDWKTNEEIGTENNFASFNYPLNDLCLSKYNGYALQLSLLRYLIEKDLGIKVDRMAIVHITDEIKEIPVVFMEKELNKMFNFMKTKEEIK